MDLLRLCRALAQMQPEIQVSTAPCLHLVIQVAERHIRNGRRWSCTACPLTLAIREQTRLDWGPAVATWGSAVVTQWSVYWSGGPELALPTEVIAWIQRYDRGGGGQPITFTLLMPCRALVIDKPTQRRRRAGKPITRRRSSPTRRRQKEKTP